MDAKAETPTYAEAIAYYLREDVSEVLWSLSRRRLLNFYYYCDRGIQDEGAVTHRKAFHCLPDAEAFRRQVTAAAARVSTCGAPFFPFFRMEPGVNVPGEAGHAAGWDFCLEIDLDQEASFQGLIPALAILEHFGVPVLGKFSGHRSLHVIVPAEAFPGSMRVAPVQPQWMAAFDCLGRFLSRLVPAVNRTSWGLAKHQPITTPYSLHRYHGRISTPLTCRQAMRFDPATASLPRFPGATWTPAQLDSDGAALEKLFGLAQELERDPALALTVATEVFCGQDWEQFASRGWPDRSARSIATALDAGPVAINFPPQLAAGTSDLGDRLRAAMQAIEDPDLKSIKYLRLFDHIGYWFDWRTGRRETCAILAVWVERGLAEAFGQLFTQAQEAGRSEYRVTRAVRLFSLLPSPPAEKFVVLKQAWSEHHRQPVSARLFLTLAAAELAAVHPESLQLFEAGTATENSRWHALLTGAAPWQTEKDPARTVAALCLAFGRDEVRTWSTEPESSAARQVTTEVFGGDRAKFKHAAATVTGPSHQFLFSV